MKRYLILGVAVTMLCGAQSFAQGVPLAATDIVGVRKSLMDLQGSVLGAMKAGVEAKSDVKPFADAAKGLVASAKVVPALFPAGTEHAGDTKAKPAIWSDQADFAKDAKALEDAAQKLVTLAEANDKAGFAAQFAEVGKTCGACHRQYKEKN